MRLNSFPQRQSAPSNPQRDEELLYHEEIGFPDDIDMPRGFNPVVNLNYGSHAREEAMVDRYGKIRLPHRIDVRKGKIFEIGVTKNVVTKMVIRFTYDETRDIIIVLMPSSGFVKTVWFNLKTDTHKTLDRSKYAVPKKKLQIS